MATLAADITELVATGMLNLDAKLMGIDDEKFVTRLVEVWNFFWVQVLPYVEGVGSRPYFLRYHSPYHDRFQVFLPLQTDPLLLSLGKAPKGPRRDSSTSSYTEKLAAPEIVRLDVRKLVLLAFRDAIILPRVSRLEELLAVSAAAKDQAGIGVEKSDGYQRPRIQQMFVSLISLSFLLLIESFYK